MRQVVEARCPGPKYSKVLLVGISSLMRAHAIPSIIHRNAPLDSVVKVPEVPPAPFHVIYDCPGPIEESSTYFTPLYLAHEPLPTMSVNAGNKYGIVGGGGINRQFAIELGAVNPALPAQFEKIHNEALKASEPIENCDVISWVFGPSRNFVNTDAGTIYVDYFMNPSQRPRGNSNNIGMIYAVGPDGRDYSMDQVKEFLSDVTTTAYTLMFAVDEWNKRYPDKSIKNIRVPLISGNIFKHPQTTAEQVAKAIREGLESYKISSPIQVVYAWAEGAFQNSNRLSTHEAIVLMHG
eukprot:Gregarina_sp_Poly_1__2942@NODE_1821_length_3272_cov_43_482995_g1181_i0_p2_GENE_NODE_1821_length_3272_cov_43_482995_g1181_i0NODE_1821_length_3272_cov_43_482995_g1181_i0_p2_ORF_typecomplete_len294_score27_27Macro/PF01661_21/0_32_NODE_1821_length_3272_cov_43_482995_g1181_i022333114